MARQQAARNGKQTTRNGEHAARNGNQTARNGRRYRMWVVYLEMGVAFVLAVLIVWWTWPKKPRKDD